MHNSSNLVILTPIRATREAKGLTIKQVAGDLRVPKSVLQEIEIGRKGTIAQRAQKIADYYMEPIERLFTPTYYREKLE